MGILSKIFCKKPKTPKNIWQTHWHLEEAWEIKTNPRLRNAVDKHGWKIVDHCHDIHLMLFRYFLYRPGNNYKEDLWSAHFNRYEELDNDEMDDIGMPPFHATIKEEILYKIDKIKRCL